MQSNKLDAQSFDFVEERHNCFFGQEKAVECEAELDSAIAKGSLCS